MPTDYTTEGITWHWDPGADWEYDGTWLRQRTAIVTEIRNEDGHWVIDGGWPIVITLCIPCEVALRAPYAEPCPTEPCGDRVYQSCNCPHEGSGVWLGHPMGRTPGEVIAGVFGLHSWRNARRPFWSDSHIWKQVREVK